MLISLSKKLVENLTKDCWKWYAYIVTCKRHYQFNIKTCSIDSNWTYITPILYLKQKHMTHILWKMKVSDEEYNAILNETRDELKEINQDHFVNWSL